MNNALASDTPDLSRLELLFAQCSPYSNGWSRISDNDATRFTQWPGQDPDGKKHARNLTQGEQVFPFEGASDCRIPTADEIINERTDFLVEAYSRALTQVMGNPEAEKSGRAGAARKLVEWHRSKAGNTLLREVTLLSQHGNTYGATLFQICWERTLGYRLHEFTMQSLLQMSDGAEPGSPLSQFPMMIQDPNLEAEAIAVLQELHLAYALAAKASNYEHDPRPLSAKRARQAIRELRKEGKCELPMPYLCANQPKVMTRKLWEDCFIPNISDGVQQAPAIFYLDYYTEATLRALAAANEWDETWLEEAVKRKGEQSEWANRRTEITNTATWTTQKVENSELIEVITAQQKLVDDDGVLAVYETIYHATIKSAPGSREALVAKHGPIEYSIGSEYPAVGWACEEVQRPFTESRGVPQIVSTWQRTLKVCEDASIDRMSLETMPPITVPSIMGVNYTFGPGAQVPLRPGARPPEAMNIVGPGGKTAEFLMERIERRVDRYFGRPRADEPPENALIKRQRLVRSFLRACGEMLAMCLKLSVNHLPPEEIESITGHTDLKADDFDDVYQLSFNVQELSPEFVALRQKGVVEIASRDASGVTDQAKVTRWLYRSLDPSLEQQLTTDVEGASGAIYKGVKDDFVDMFMGVPPQLRENEPTAAQQLQYANQILSSSQEYQKKLQEDQRFREWVEMWMKSKQHSVDQQANVQTGKVGVDARQFQPAGGMAA